MPFNLGVEPNSEPQTRYPYFLLAMASDLPVELWLYIISLLPSSHRQKLIGINRVLFRLAMDEIYQEVRFMDDNAKMLKTFHQLR